MTTMRQYSCVSDELLETIAALDRAIFSEPMSKETFASELRTRHNLCVLIAERGPTPVGYKIGYELSPDVFYSFSGGVVPEYRRQGIARALIREQHRIASELGYSVVRTHTKNKYRDMLVLNIESGFDVTGVNHKSGEKFHSIILEKVLVKTSNEGTA
jgi:ribosomal protein S18 acetylase RimI-like enzyme